MSNLVVPLQILPVILPVKPPPECPEDPRIRGNTKLCANCHKQLEEQNRIEEDKSVGIFAQL